MRPYIPSWACTPSNCPARLITRLFVVLSGCRRQWQESSVAKIVGAVPMGNMKSSGTTGDDISTVIGNIRYTHIAVPLIPFCWRIRPVNDLNSVWVGLGVMHVLMFGTEAKSTGRPLSCLRRASATMPKSDRIAVGGSRRLYLATIRNQTRKKIQYLYHIGCLAALHYVQS